MLTALALMLSFNGLDQIVDSGAVMKKTATGFRFTEGPAWLREGKLAFSDIPENKMFVWDGTKSSVFRDPSGNANGNTIGPDGLLYTAHHASRDVTIQVDGKVSVVVGEFGGKKFNSPNDLVHRKNGDLYFTDPPYGLGGKPSDVGFSGVFLYRKSKELVALARDFETPNGIAFSPDEKVCYVADTRKKHVRAFEVRKDGTFGAGRMFAENMDGNPDGMRVDQKGNLYVAAGGGIHVFDSKGVKLGLIPVPENPTNLAWGGKDGKTMYVTARTSVYEIRVKIAGVRF
jgi:sugar lactone lactonase YvrE